MGTKMSINIEMGIGKREYVREWECGPLLFPSRLCSTINQYRSFGGAPLLPSWNLRAEFQPELNLAICSSEIWHLAGTIL